MAKAINWPEQFHEEVLAESTDSPKIALRIGSLYFDNGYYVNGEIVDIRVNHKIVRKGQIQDEMRLSQIKDLSADEVKSYKTPLQDKSNIIDFLSNNYNQPVNEETFVTVITYKNLPLEAVDVHDDPHNR